MMPFCTDPNAAVAERIRRDGGNILAADPNTESKSVEDVLTDDDRERIDSAHDENSTDDPAEHDDDSDSD